MIDPKSVGTRSHDSSPVSLKLPASPTFNEHTELHHASPHLATPSPHLHHAFTTPRHASPRLVNSLGQPALGASRCASTMASQMPRQQSWSLCLPLSLMRNTNAPHHQHDLSASPTTLLPRMVSRSQTRLMSSDERIYSHQDVREHVLSAPIDAPTLTHTSKIHSPRRAVASAWQLAMA